MPPSFPSLIIVAISFLHLSSAQTAQEQQALCAMATSFPSTPCDSSVNFLTIFDLDIAGWNCSNAATGCTTFSGVFCTSGVVTTLTVQPTDAQGPIPTQIGLLSNLTYLYDKTHPPLSNRFRSINFGGLFGDPPISTIPTQIGMVTQLSYLYATTTAFSF